MLPFQEKEPWRADAKCAGHDTEKFYPPRKRELYKTIADEAKGICKGHDGRPPCPVLFDCLAYAIERDEEHGIWGGMSHRERNALVRKMRRMDKAHMSFKQFMEKGPPV